MMMTTLESRIRDRAYAIWEREGRPEGREVQNWHQAVREVLASGDLAIGGKPDGAGKNAETVRRSGRGRPRRAA